MDDLDDLESLDRGPLVSQEPTQLIVRPVRFRRFLWAAALVSMLALAFVSVRWWSSASSDSTRASGPDEGGAVPPGSTEIDLLIDDARHALDEGRLDETEAILNAIEAHQPDHPGVDPLSASIEKARLTENLPIRFVARHEHLVGHCTGDLALRDDGVVFESSRHGVWHWHADEIEQLLRPRGDAITVRLGREKYDMTFLRPPLSRDTFERYREALEMARRADASASE